MNRVFGWIIVNWLICNWCVTGGIIPVHWESVPCRCRLAILLELNGEIAYHIDYLFPFRGYFILIMCACPMLLMFSKCSSYVTTSFCNIPMLHQFHFNCILCPPAEHAAFRCSQRLLILSSLLVLPMVPDIPTEACIATVSVGSIPFFLKHIVQIDWLLSWMGLIDMDRHTHTDI